MFKNFNEYLDYACNKILCGLLKDGGEGLRGAVIGCINAYTNWQNIEKKENKKS